MNEIELEFSPDTALCHLVERLAESFPDAGAEFVAVDLNMSLRQAMRELLEKMDYCPCNLSSSKLPTVWGSGRAQCVLFRELIENAILYGRRGGLIQLSVEETDDDYVFSLNDDGPGLQASDREKVFEPFHRGEKGVREGRAGLGLFLCRRIAESVGGRIWIEESPRGGCSVKWTAPRSEKH